MRETFRRLNEVEREMVALPRRDVQVRTVAQILTRHAPSMPKSKTEIIIREIESVIDHEALAQELMGQNINLLGALATAGMFALAFEHEFARQLTVLEELSERVGSSSKLSNELSGELNKWIRRVRQTRTIFSSLSDEDSRRKRQRFNAKSAIEQFVVQAQPFLGGVDINLDGLDEAVRLPAGTFAEWSALFQNIFANAANAMIDKKRRQIAISSRGASGRHSILVQDTGAGVNLDEAEKLFEPFERRINISKERKALAIGGTGLGLTIVRLISRNLGFSVSFMKPQMHYATCLKIEWQERGQ